MKDLKKKSGCFALGLAVLISGLLMDGCGEKVHKNNQGHDQENIQKRNRVILKINESTFYNSHFENYVSNMVGDEAGELTAASLSRLVDNFIEENILLLAARAKNISLTLEEKKEYLAKMGDESWRKGEQSLDEKRYRTMFEGLLVGKYTYQLVKDIQVSDQEIEQYYHNNKREFLKPERVEVSQILLQTEDKAIEILERLQKASGQEFRDTAKKESVGVEAAKGGKMGLFEMGELPFEMEKVVFSLIEGEVSQVMESAYGYHIFRLDKRYEPELLSLEEAAESIKVKILDKKINQTIFQHIQELKKQMVWTFYPQNLSFPYQRNIP